MYKEEALQAILAEHDATLVYVEGSVCEVWEDGEVTMTKCGDIFRQRTLHCMKRAGQNNPDVVAWFKANLPMQSREHSSAYVPYAVAEKLGRMIDDSI